MKATEMAISNPLIDDYTLKGAKGLLVNITGGKDLKLFEVDEVVNKIRSEVEADAEVIIGAITDPSLDGKIRVSIVATIRWATTGNKISNKHGSESKTEILVILIFQILVQTHLFIFK